MKSDEDDLLKKWEDKRKSQRDVQMRQTSRHAFSTTMKKLDSVFTEFNDTGFDNLEPVQDC